jgi:hypothetical protein
MILRDRLCEFVTTFSATAGERIGFAGRAAIEGVSPPGEELPSAATTTRVGEAI